MSDLAVVFDIQALQNPLHRDRGIGRYVVEHVDALLDAGAPVHALVLNPLVAAPRLPERWHALGLVRWNRPQVLRDARRDGRRVVYHVPSPFEPAVPEDGVVVPHALRGADVLSVMLHDAIPFRFPERYQRDDASRAFFRRRAVLTRRADVVVTNSESTATDAVGLLAVERGHVVVQGAGVARFLTEPAGVAPAALPAEVRPPFVFTVSGWGDPRKDLTTALAAFAALDPPVRDAHQLVVACELPPEGRRAWTDEARTLGLRDDEVVFLGRVEDDVLRMLYEQCALFVFSSRYEGFGFPVLEAAACGAATLTTDASSLPEVLDLAAATVPAGDERALARAMTRALADDAFASELRHAGALAATRHTWSAVVTRTLAAWRAAPELRRRDLPVRAAVAGPFPPSKSGVATFDARLVAALARDTGLELDCFRESDDPMPSPRSQRAWRELPIQALGRSIHPGSYDAVVHVLGNGHAHRHTLAASLAHPGIVWLHDARLAGLYLSAAGLFVPGQEPGPAEIAAARATMAATLARVYGPHAPQPGDDEWWRTEWYAANGCTLLQEVVAGAVEVIVNTTAARDAVLAAARDRDVPVHVLPHPFPELDVPADRPDAAEPLVITLGWVDPVKRPHDLVRAIGRVARTKPCRLAFVGEVAPALRAELETAAADAGLGDRVTFTGFAETAEYASWLARADLVVQLRAATYGEASGALCDAIACGRPVLTSIDTATDLPPGVVAHIDPHAPVADLAVTILGLLSDPERRRALAAAARKHAASWRYADLARAVATILRDHAVTTALPIAGAGSR